VVFIIGFDGASAPRTDYNIRNHAVLSETLACFLIIRQKNQKGTIFRLCLL